METTKLTNLQKAIEIVDEVKALHEQIHKKNPSVDVRARAAYDSLGEVSLNIFVFVGVKLLDNIMLSNFGESNTKDFEQFREHIMNDVYGKSAKEILLYYKRKQLEKLEAELAENGE